MSWFHHTLTKLQSMLNAIRENPTEKGFREFYSEVNRRHERLMDEKKKIEMQRSDIEIIHENIASIAHEFSDITMHEDDDFERPLREVVGSERYTKIYLRRHQESMDKIKTLMEDTHERLEKIDKSLGLIRNTEKTIEE